MGTRNITRVIHNGEFKVCQYGQWDGYPTSAGVKILEFVKEGNFEEIKKCKVTVNDDDCTFTGAPCTELVVEMAWAYSKAVRDASYDCGKAYETIKDKFGEEKFLEFLAASRDTGVDILWFAPKDLYANEYVYSLERPDWQIEAINTINLDNETVEMQWHNKMKVYAFDKIAKMDIENEMMDFEEED